MFFFEVLVTQCDLLSCSYWATLFRHHSPLILLNCCSHCWLQPWEGSRQALRLILYQLRTYTIFSSWFISLLTMWEPFPVNNWSIYNSTLQRHYLFCRAHFTAYANGRKNWVKINKYRPVTIKNNSIIFTTVSIYRDIRPFTLPL